MIDKDMTDALEEQGKYKVILSTDGKCTIMFTGEHSAELLNTLDSLLPVWARMKQMAGDAKAVSATAVNVAVTKTQGDAGNCPIHNLPLQWGTSKKGTSYKYHKINDTMCFGHS